MSKTRATDSGRITAIKAAADGRPARVVYIVSGKDAHGQTRHATLSAAIPEEDFDSLRRELRVGDTAEFTFRGEPKPSPVPDTPLVADIAGGAEE